MDEFLSFVTIDVWTMIMTWGNLLILFFAMKKFLFKPVKNIMDKRQEEIEKSISDAELAKEEAANLKEEYEKRLSSAKIEADQVIKTAVKNAQLKEEEIIKDANKKASDILQRADKEIENRKNAAFSDIKDEVSEIAISIATKIIKKDINEKDHEKLINEFIDEIGDAS